MWVPMEVIYALIEATGRYLGEPHDKTYTDNEIELAFDCINLDKMHIEAREKLENIVSKKRRCKNECFS